MRVSTTAFLLVCIAQLVVRIHGATPLPPTDYDSSVLPTGMPAVLNIAWLGPLNLPNPNTLFHGAPGLVGFMLAVEEANASPWMSNTQVKVMYADSQSDSSLSITNTYDFIQQGAVGLIGEYVSGLAQVSQYVAQKYRLPQISPGATSLDFTKLHDKSYPYFMRVVPNIGVIASMMAQFTKSNGWNRVGLIFTSDAFGSGGAAAYTATAAQVGVRVDVSVSYGVGDSSDFAFLVQRLITANVRIFVYWGLPGDLQILWRYIKAFSSVDLVAEPYQWILNHGDTVPTLVQDSTGLILPDIYTMCLGQVGIQSDINEKTQEYAQFEKVFRARPRWNVTYSVDPAGDLPVYAMNTYDATWQMIRGWHRMIYQVKKDPTLLDNRKQFYDTIRTTNFTGVTGPIEMDAVGDRVTPFAIVNFQRSSGKWITVARMVNNELVMADNQKFEYVGSHPDVRPIDTPLRNLTKFSSQTKTALIAMSCIIIGLIGLLQIYVVINRDNKIMKSASPIFLILFLFGVQLLCASVIPRTMEGEVDMSPSPCNADLYLSNLGYTVLIGALLVKTARLQFIFNRKQLKSTLVFTDFRLFMGLVVLVVIELIPLLCLSLGKPMTIQLREKSEFNDYYTCRTSNESVNELDSIYLPVVMTFRFALLALTTLCVFKVKDLPSDFNESTQLGTTMYNLLFLSILLPAIDGALGRGLETPLIAYSSCIFIICVASVLILFVPKIWTMYVHPPISTKQTSNSKDHSSGASSQQKASGGQGNKGSHEHVITLGGSNGTSPYIGGGASRGMHASTGTPRLSTGRSSFHVGTSQIAGRPGSTGPLPPLPRGKSTPMKDPKLTIAMDSFTKGPGSGEQSGIEMASQHQSPRESQRGGGNNLSSLGVSRISASNPQAAGQQQQQHFLSPTSSSTSPPQSPSGPPDANNGVTGSISREMANEWASYLAQREEFEAFQRAKQLQQQQQQQQPAAETAEPTPPQQPTREQPTPSPRESVDSNNNNNSNNNSNNNNANNDSTSAEAQV